MEFLWKKIMLIPFIGILLVTNISSQQLSLEPGIIIGGSNYSGDLSSDDITTTLYQTLPAAGVFVRMNLNTYLKSRIQFATGRIQGADKYSNEDWQLRRNLDFSSYIYEVSISMELHPLKYWQGNQATFSPYLSAGGGLFYFNPVTEYKGQRITLQELGTEGQGSVHYPDKLPYQLTSISIPIGGGVQLALNDGIQIGLEIGWRFTLTDYLDDISGSFADYDLLRFSNGELAALLAYRDHELTGVIEPYPFSEGSPRGNPDSFDSYAIGAMTISYIPETFGKWSARRGRGKRINTTRCPSF